MPNKTVDVKSDGQEYSFTPGKNGSLISKRKYIQESLIKTSGVKSKIVPSEDMNSSISTPRKNRSNIIKILTASSRG